VLVDDGRPVLADHPRGRQDLGPDRARVLGWPGPLLLAGDLAVLDSVLPAIKLNPDLLQAWHLDLDLSLAEHAVRLRAGDRRPIETPHDRESEPARELLQDPPPLDHVREAVAGQQDHGEISCGADREVVTDRRPGHPVSDAAGGSRLHQSGGSPGGVNANQYRTIPSTSAPKMATSRIAGRTSGNRSARGAGGICSKNGRERAGAERNRPVDELDAWIVGSGWVI
jgi:hypothetical protein